LARRPLGFSRPYFSPAPLLDQPVAVRIHSTRLRITP
jgi:hypothetical protein